MEIPNPPAFIRPVINLQVQDKSSIQTIPELIEHNAALNPHHFFCIQAQKRIHSAGPAELLSVSHLQLKCAISSCQTWLLDSIAELKLSTLVNGRIRGKGLPVALFVESDVGLLIHLFSLMSLGVPVLLLSARLSPIAIHHLLVKTAACAIIASPRIENAAKEGLSNFATSEDRPRIYTQAAFTNFLNVPIKQDCTNSGICKPGYFTSENDRNVLILHSSGTTGLPKPIYQSHKWLLCFATCHQFSSDEEALSVNLSTLPLYHGYGLVTPALSLAIGKTLCIPPPSIIPTGPFIVSLLKQSNALSLISVPSILEEISLLPRAQGLEVLASLQFVAFGGGLLKRSVGEKLTAGGAKLLNHYGSTESGPIAPFFVPSPEYDWNYFRLRNDVELRLEPGPLTANDVQSFTLTMRPFGWESCFTFQDQLISNPRNAGSEFSAIGRTDDLILLANGEKVTPRILETSLFENELVTVAVAFGDGQFEVGVIIQPSSPLKVESYDNYKSSIWPVVVQAGDQMDAHARITSKEAIIVIPFETVLPRSDKGSIMRKEVYKLFEAEIAAIYQNLDDSTLDADGTLLDMGNLEQDLKNMIQGRLKWRVNPEGWTVYDDLFELGMDSLQVVQLRRFILSSIPETSTSKPKAERIPRDIIYRNPTVAELALAIKDPDESFLGRMSVNDFVKQYSIKPDRVVEVSDPAAAVLVTGGTGSLGSYLVAHLASLPGIARVICLNRPHLTLDGHARQLEALRSKNIMIDPTALKKIEVFQSNTALPSLGLSKANYAYLQAHVTHIIHNAWPMDFKRTLPSFKAQFQILHNLLELARNAHKIHLRSRTKVLYVSSIAVVGHFPLLRKETIVPEVFMTDERCTNEIGYAKAKLVCEKIIEKAAQDHASETEVAYVRLGQICGSKKNGSWNTDEHIAALFKSSQAIGSLPCLEGTLSWMPVDYAAEASVELLLSKDLTKVVYHLENPIRQSWRDVLNTVAPELNLPNTEFIPFDRWIDQVCAVPDELNETVPVKKLENFFRADFEHMACGSIILDTKNARDMSSTLRKLSHVSRDLLVSYIRHWKSVGYLN